MDKKLITVASIIFALVFIVVLSIIFGVISETNSNSVNSLGQSISAISDTELSRFDNKMMSGKMVKETIHTLRETNKGVKLGYAVCTQTVHNDANNWKYYGYCGLGYSTTASNYIIASGSQTQTYYDYKPTSTGLVNSVFIEDNTEFMASLVKNNQNVVVGVAFAKIS